MTLPAAGSLKRVNFDERSTRPKPVAAAFCALLVLVLTGCSAFELVHKQSSVTGEAGAAAATENPTAAALEKAVAELRATEQTYSVGATQAAATIAALAATPPTPDEAVSPAPASAETAVYGSVPIDSDGLNIIAALAFDADGNLLAATRAGEIYALPDADGDGRADETRLIFADERQQLGQVAGLIVQGRALILLHGDGLSRLSDEDGDGLYETATRLAEGRPGEQSPLQASNGLVRAPDGRLFTVDINAGEILQIHLRQ